MVSMRPSRRVLGTELIDVMASTGARPSIGGRRGCGLGYVGVYEGFIDVGAGGHTVAEGGCHFEAGIDHVAYRPKPVDARLTGRRHGNEGPGTCLVGAGTEFAKQAVVGYRARGGEDRVARMRWCGV